MKANGWVTGPQARNTWKPQKWAGKGSNLPEPLERVGLLAL